MNEKYIGKNKVSEEKCLSMEKIQQWPNGKQIFEKKDEILIIMLGDAHLKNASISFMVTNLFGKKRRCFRSCNLPVKLQQWPYVQKVMEKVTRPFRPMTKSHST